MFKSFVLLFSLILSSNIFAACAVEVSSSDNLKFNKNKLTINSSCVEFKINFKHNGEMAAKTAGHNVVITESRHFESVVSKIDMSLGESSGFLLNMKEIIAKTAIIGGGSQVSVTIDATKLSKKNNYTFFCSFPGHYGVMKGVVEVI